LRAEVEVHNRSVLSTSQGLHCSSASRAALSNVQYGQLVPSLQEPLPGGLYDGVMLVVRSHASAEMGMDRDNSIMEASKAFPVQLIAFMGRTELCDDTLGFF
jgi:hypothetical protein